MSQTLAGKTIVITGASRGIGREIALRCARDGANIVVGAKSAEPHPKLPGTIFSVAEEVTREGGQALPIKVDVREEEEVRVCMEEAVKTFGGIDALINNAGAINLTTVETTPLRRYDLMHDTNARASFLCSQMALTHLKKATNPHIINLSPPISLDPKWYEKYTAYTLSKFGMSMCTIGMAAEFRPYGIAVNSLWPRTIVATAAIEWLMGEEGMKKSRKPAIMADAIYALLTTQSRELTGQFLLDEDFLRTRGVTDFTPYAVTPGAEPSKDIYVD